MTLAEMRKLKAEYALTVEMIANRSGVPLGTVQKVFGGVTNAPRKQTLDALEAVFLEEAAKKKDRTYCFEETTPEIVREPAAVYGATPKQKLYTIEDYYALPDEQRVELIDGVFYDMAAPSCAHQLVLADLLLLFRQCVDDHNSPCEVVCAPCDVRLDLDDFTMVQPDLMVLCKDELIEKRRIEGAPDLVVEILSPSTRKKDQFLKLVKYMNAGVREYWIVDLEKKMVVVHTFEAEDYIPKLYPFMSEIPIHISGGKCSIDFTKVQKRLDRHGW